MKPPKIGWGLKKFCATGLSGSHFCIELSGAASRRRLFRRSPADGPSDNAIFADFPASSQQARFTVGAARLLYQLNARLLDPVEMTITISGCLQIALCTIASQSVTTTQIHDIGERLSLQEAFDVIGEDGKYPLRIACSTSRHMWCRNHIRHVP